ncbi:ATP-binding protein [Streptomyces sp. NPDC051940]|uniref:ATP-binding protein n=1 Tax=Streptomyces sp. NPDC051940 TaxID=3155675 RepID=UPI00344311D0
METAIVIAVAAVAIATGALLWVRRLREQLRTVRAESARRRARAQEEATRADEAERRAAEAREATAWEREQRDAVLAAFETVAGNVHAMATVQLQLLDGIEQRLTDPELMGEVMRADHAAAQMIRKAQTLLVMCGIWPARREPQPVSLFDCVRGAQSRILEYGRIEVHGGQHLHVAAPAAEGMMHAVAELLENAADFSPSSSQVVVSIREVAAGAAIQIDDAGLGMPSDVLEQALGRLRGGQELVDLGAMPKLGLACVGRWSRELGFSVELSAGSAYGGTRAAVFVPNGLLTEPSTAEEGPVEEPAEVISAPARADGETALPRRRSRRRPGEETGEHRRPVVPEPARTAPVSDWSPQAARASVAGVLAGTERGRARVRQAREQTMSPDPDRVPPQEHPREHGQEGSR